MIEIEKKIDKVFELCPPDKCIIFSGSSGLGKTYNVHRLGEKHNMPIEIWGDKKTETTRDAILFVDEAQALNKTEQKDLYAIIDAGYRYVVDFIRSQAIMQKSRRKVIIASTNIGYLIEPIRTRGIVFDFSFYDDEMIVAMLLKDKRLSKKEAEMIAGFGKGIPRQAKTIADCYLKSRESGGGMEYVKEMLNIDDRGYTLLERKYLITLFQSEKATSQAHLCQVLGLDPKTLRDTIETIMRRDRLMVMTPQGRTLTALGKDYVKESILQGVL